MKIVIQLAVLTSMISSAYAAPLVVYGKDDRHEVYEATAANQLLAKSTAVAISKFEMTRDAQKPGLVQFTQITLKESMEVAAEGEEEEEEYKSRKLFSKEVKAAIQNNVTLCEDTKFANQPTPGMCSGFLIGPDLLVTAGHCIDIPNFCNEYQWVFDFELDKKTQKAGVDVKEDTIYSCEKVVSTRLFTEFGYDYGVIKLNRKVKDRAPLKINSSLAGVSDTAKVLVIGSPSGLPTKVSPNGEVKKNTHSNFFVTSLDTFQGNSGSAVINEKTGVVEGILVRGAEDYVPDYTRMCIKVNDCTDVMGSDVDPLGRCRGEEVSRMTSIPEVASQNDLYAAATSGNTVKLVTILSKRLWVDFYTVDGQSALIKAAGAAQNASIKILLSKGADVNLSDAKGNTALHELAGSLNEQNTEVLTTLMEAGAKLEVKNDLGQSPLLVAGSVVNLDAVKLLIFAGADKNAVDLKGENVLFSFLRAGQEKAVVELAGLGVDIKPVLAIATTKQKIKLKLLKIAKK